MSSAQLTELVADLADVKARLAGLRAKCDDIGSTIDVARNRHASLSAAILLTQDAFNAIEAALADLRAEQGGEP